MCTFSLDFKPRILQLWQMGGSQRPDVCDSGLFDELLDRVKKWSWLKCPWNLEKSSS